MKGWAGAKGAGLVTPVNRSCSLSSQTESSWTGFKGTKEPERTRLWVFTSSSSEVVLCKFRYCRNKIHPPMLCGIPYKILLNYCQSPSVSHSFLMKWEQWGGGGFEPLWSWINTKQCCESYLCTQCETNASKRWKIISSQQALVLKLQRCCACWHH